MFTQPKMYKTIQTHPTTLNIYAQKLIREKVLTEDEIEKQMQGFITAMDDAFEASKGYKPNKADWMDGVWSGMAIASGDARRGETGCSIEFLKEVGAGLTRVPDNFTPHSKIERQLASKAKMIETGEGIDWSTAEALAFGTLVVEGHPVRLSGEDCERGTFSQRHSVLIDQETEERHTPLQNIRFGQAPFEVLNSPLSEFGVLGFESVSYTHLTLPTKA